MRSEFFISLELRPTSARLLIYTVIVDEQSLSSVRTNDNWSLALRHW